MTKLQCTVKRGRHIGTILTPHLHKDHQYVVSRTRFARDYIRVRHEADLLKWVDKGYSLRMSNPAVAGHRAPSLIAPESIDRK